MRQPIVQDLRSKTKDLTSKAKAKDFIKCPRGQGHGIEDFITAYNINRGVPDVFFPTGAGSR